MDPHEPCIALCPSDCDWHSALVAGSSFGTAFRVTTAGESHGPANLVIVDGCPPGLPLCPEDIEADLARRRPGQSRLTTQRREADKPEILSGLFEGETTGTPIAILVRNADARSKDYDAIRHLYRPGHADYTYDAKFGRRDHRGGGRASARETVARVAAGAVARKLLQVFVQTEILAYTLQVGSIRASIPDPKALTRKTIETLPDGSPNLVRCPDPAAAREMEELIDSVRKARDSIGGIGEFVAHPVPAGWGEPIFDKLKADLAKAILSLPGVLGFEYGVGFSCATMRGSEANDAFTLEKGQVRTTENRHGGMLGGISSGMPIVARAAIKPTSSIPQRQQTVSDTGDETSIEIKGRHDPCLLPRFAPMAEAMVALTLADHFLRQRMIEGHRQ